MGKLLGSLIVLLAVVLVGIAIRQNMHANDMRQIAGLELMIVAAVLAVIGVGVFCL